MNLDELPHPATCPACGAVVASRRARVCGVCEAPLPPTVRFTPEEAKQHAKAFQQIRERVRSANEVSSLDRVAPSEGGLL